MTKLSVDELLDQIEQLPDEDRVTLERRLAAKHEAEWSDAVSENEHLAKERGIDDAAIQRAIDRRRNRA